LGRARKEPIILDAPRRTGDLVESGSDGIHIRQDVLPLSGRPQLNHVWEDSGVRMNRSWDQQAADNDLHSYPYRLEVRGTPGSLTWPDVCAHCGGGAAERVRVRRAFYRRARGRRSRGFFGYQVVSADLPLCPSCAVHHRATVPRVSWFRRYRWWLLNPAHIATIGCAVLLVATLPNELDPALISTGSLSTWGISGICVFGIVWIIGITWWKSRPDRFEPLSEITSACAISQNLSEFFERPRHLYGFRNQAFADAFGRLNQARVWTERDQARMWKKWSVATILLILVFGGARLLLWYYEGR